MCAKWIDKSENRVETLARQLEKLKIHDKSGKMEGWQGFGFEYFLTAIESYLVLDKEIPHDEKYGILYGGLISVANKGQLTAKRILGAVSKEENAYLKKQKNDYILVTSLSINYFKELRRITKSSHPITFNSKLPNRFDREKPATELKSYYKGEEPANYTFVQIRVKARSEHEAFRTAIDDLDLLRGVFNLFLRETLISHFHRGLPQPINKVTLGNLHTLHLPNGKSATDMFWYERDYVDNVTDVSKKWHELLKFKSKTLRFLKKHPYRAEVEDFIRRYTRALDYRDLHVSFLELWILLEKMTATSNAQYEKMIERVAFLYKDVDLNKQVLQHLRLYRNSNVHAGQRSERIEGYIYQLKSYVEQLLFFNIQNSFKFKSVEELASFLDLSTDKSRLKKKVELLNKGIKFRT